MADKKIVDLTALVTQNTTDIYEISNNGLGSFKESRDQQASFFKTLFPQIINNLNDLSSRVSATQNLGIPPRRSAGGAAEDRARRPRVGRCSSPGTRASTFRVF